MVILILLLSAGCNRSRTGQDNALPVVHAQSTLFASPWINGARTDEPALQAKFIDPATMVIRQSLNSSFEAPFMYLLRGEHTVLLIDTGAGGIDLRSFVDTQISAWQNETMGSPLSLVVMHTHPHQDHIAGDAQFLDRPNTSVIGHALEDMFDVFALDNWPDKVGLLDLGGRIVDIIPTPGHHELHVMIHDRSRQLLFSGDALYPGRLYFRCNKSDQFRESIHRLSLFANQHPIRWVLGAHIELSTRPGVAFSSEDRNHADERRLELPPSSISDLLAALDQVGSFPRITESHHFILFPHPANPQGKRPADWCRPAELESQD